MSYSKLKQRQQLFLDEPARELQILELRKFMTSRCARKRCLCRYGVFEVQLHFSQALYCDSIFNGVLRRRINTIIAEMRRIPDAPGSGADVT